LWDPEECEKTKRRRRRAVIMRRGREEEKRKTKSSIFVTKLTKTFEYWGGNGFRGGAEESSRWLPLNGNSPKIRT
jgi:hypothetical protein